MIIPIPSPNVMYIDLPVWAVIIEFVCLFVITFTILFNIARSIKQ